MGETLSSVQRANTSDCTKAREQDFVRISLGGRGTFRLRGYRQAQTDWKHGARTYGLSRDPPSPHSPYS